MCLFPSVFEFSPPVYRAITQHCNTGNPTSKRTILIQYHLQKGKYKDLKMTPSSASEQSANGKHLNHPNQLPSACAFITPLPTSSSSYTSSPSPYTTSFMPCVDSILPRKHHMLCIFRLLRRPRTSSVPIVALQARTVSGDNNNSSDGEVTEHITPNVPQKSFSVGLTIVSGFDPALRRSVIERIVANADAGRVVVVTTGGILSTDETDRLSTEKEKHKLDIDDVVAVDDNDRSKTIETSKSAENSVSDDLNNGTNLSGVPNLEGWISCSSSEEMAEVVLKLAVSRECDYILAESALDADMEPQILAQTLHARGGASLRVDTLVSVLDGDTLLNDLLASPQPPSQQSLQSMPQSSSSESTANDTSESTANDTSESSIPCTEDTNESASMTTRTTTSVSESWRIQELSQQRPMILVSLVEHANVIVVTQGGGNEVRNEQLSRVHDVVSVLNGNARIVPLTDENLAVGLLINTKCYDNEITKFNPTWMKVLRATRPASISAAAAASTAANSKSNGVGGGNNNGENSQQKNTVNLGNIKNESINNNNSNNNSSTNNNISSNNSNGGTVIMSPIKPVGLPKALKEATFLYKAKRPFHPPRLYQHIKDVATFAGVIRSTGTIWLATRMLAPLEWNQAGVAATLKAGKLFWAARPENEWPVDEEERSQIMSKWDNRYGDRETEIVFVGIGIDKVRLQGLLDGCLLQDEEMVFNNLWENFEDPFEQWVPLADDDEEEEEEVLSVPPTAAVPEPEPTPEPVNLKHEEEIVVGSKGLKDDGVENEERDRKVDEEIIEKTESDDVENEDKKVIEAIEKQINDNRVAIVNEDDIPDEIFDELTALDLFQQGFSDDEDTDLVAQSEDAGTYDREDAVIASWDGSVADGILTKIPQIGMPVTLVTGFLGSGKTTLLNYILTADHGLRIAILVNEFGEIDIDNQLVQKGDWNNSNDVMELSNGCICCDINDSFISAVEKILERKKDIDYVIVETTGVADPGPIINSLMMTDIADHVRLDGVLTLVDCENFNVKDHMGSEAALAQIMAADSLLLSKTDVCSQVKVDEVVEFIKSMRPAARILKSQRGRVPIDLILDVGLRIAESTTHMNPDVVDVAVEEKEEHSLNKEHSHDHDHTHEHDHAHDCGPDCNDESHSHSHSKSNHLEVDGFVTTSFKSDQPLDTRLFMDNFLRTLPEGVFRAKGLLYFYGFDERYIFQLSGRRYHMQMDDWPENDAPGNQLVIIGRDLDLKQLRDTLESCHANIPE